MSWQPRHEVEIIAGTPPGGGLDRSARALAAALAECGALARRVQVINVSGDGSRKAWVELAQRRGDPHVLCISSSNLATDHLLGASPFRHETDFTPLAILYTEYIAFLARADSGLASAADLLGRLGATAGSLTVALSTAAGNPNHIALAKVVRHAGGDVKAPRIRVFGSALDAVADVVAGHADIAAVTAASAVTELAAGSLRALAVSSPQRLAGPYADTPTWRESGVDCEIGAWRGATGSAGLTPEQARFWATALAAAVATDVWRRELARHYWTAMHLDGAELRAFLARESAEMRSVLQDLGLMKA